MKYWIAIFCLSLIACTESNLPKTKRPANILDHEMMSKILTEVHYAESKVNLDKINSKKSKDLIDKYYRQILSQYNIDDEKFFNSLDYYYQVPDTLNIIYSKVINQMTKDQKRVDEQLKKEDN